MHGISVMFLGSNRDVSSPLCFFSLLSIIRFEIAQGLGSKCAIINDKQFLDFANDITLIEAKKASRRRKRESKSFGTEDYFRQDKKHGN